jgi:hypothetical protein
MMAVQSGKVSGLPEGSPHTGLQHNHQHQNAQQKFVFDGFTLTLASL